MQIVARTARGAIGNKLRAETSGLRVERCLEKIQDLT